MRIGLVGWATRTGIGQMCRELWDHKVVDSWLVPIHPTIGVDASVVPCEGDFTVCARNDTDAAEAWLSKIDVLMFVEHNDYIFGQGIVGMARGLDKRVVCIPMMEWLPFAPWVADVDMMWAVTEWTARELEAVSKAMSGRGYPCRWEKRIYGGRWGVDLNRFKFTPRQKVNRFIFCNGTGGVLNRKGADVVIKAARIADHVPILFRSQKRDMPLLASRGNIEYDFTNYDTNEHLFDDGDVLLAPSRWEGLGLQLYEAQACGLPVITTNALPMRECRPLRTISCLPGAPVDLSGRMTTPWEASPSALAAILTDLYGTDITDESVQARKFVENHHDLSLVCEALRAAAIQR